MKQFKKQIIISKFNQQIIYSLMKQELHQIPYKKQQSISLSETKTDKKSDQFNDRWMEFKILVENIPPRSYHIAVVYDNALYVQGGYDVDTGILSDFHKLQLVGTREGFKWEQLNQKQQNYPGKLKSHSAVVYEDKLIIFGGQIHSNQNNNLTFIYNFSSNKWSKIYPNIDLPKLDSHSAFIRKNKMYVYGGFSDTQAEYQSKIYELDLQKWQWSLFYEPDHNTEVPLPRGNFGLVYYQDYAWIFGGINETNTLNDMWKFDIQNKKWTAVQTKQNVPQARRSHSMVLFENEFYIFGGIQDVTKQKNDIHIYSPLKNTWTTLQNCSNLVYQDLSTKSKSKQQIDSVKQYKTDKKIHPMRIGHTGSEHRPNAHIENLKEHPKNILGENKHKKFLEKKHSMLKQFDTVPQEILEIRKLSPTSQNMLKTLKVIGSQWEIKKLKSQIQYDPTHKYIFGKKPCARDAHTAVIHKNNMIIFGGDRHLMSFSDVYNFELKKQQK